MSTSSMLTANTYYLNGWVRSKFIIAKRSSKSSKFIDEKDSFNSFGHIG